MCLNANTIKAPARGRTAVQHVDHFLLGADMYTCKPARTYPAAQISVGRIREKCDLQHLIGPTPYLTIPPDALKLLPEAPWGIRKCPGVQNIDTPGEVPTGVGWRDRRNFTL